MSAFFGAAANRADLRMVLETNPGVGFADPDGYIGNRPFYITDDKALTARRNAAKAWLFDPEGISGPASTPHSATPGGPVETRRENAAVLAANTTSQFRGFDEVGKIVNWQTPDEAAALEKRFGTAETNAANRAAMSGKPLVAMIPAAVVPSVGLPVVFVQPKPAPTNGTVTDRYLVNGKLMDGTGTVLNANRDASDTALVGGGAPISAPKPHVLPTNNTTADAPFDWKKHAPLVIGLLILLVIIYMMSKNKKGAA